MAAAAPPLCLSLPSPLRLLWVFPRLLGVSLSQFAPSRFRFSLRVLRGGGGWGEVGGWV